MSINLCNELFPYLNCYVYSYIYRYSAPHSDGLEMHIYKNQKPYLCRMTLRIYKTYIMIHNVMQFLFLSAVALCLLLNSIQLL